MEAYLDFYLFIFTPRCAFPISHGITVFQNMQSTHGFQKLNPPPEVVLSEMIHLLHPLHRVLPHKAGDYVCQVLVFRMNSDPWKDKSADTSCCFTPFLEGI